MQKCFSYLCEEIMKVQEIKLKNFRRFTDLEISGIPASAKLVLLIGSNGSGKSSVFDAFELFNTISKGESVDQNTWSYYRKQSTEPVVLSLLSDEGKEWVATEDGSISHTNAGRPFYGRTSFRQVPRLTRRSLGTVDINLGRDNDRPRYFIEKDNRFENDVEKITETILREFFRSADSKDQIRARYIGPINLALENVFGNINGTRLELVEIIPPLEGRTAEITFRKGKSEFHYNYLSAGEKEVFNLLLNLLSRKDLYQNTIYFLDEIDLHLNTKIQHNLLKELCENWIPNTCQLWTASHSLGFIEFARHYEYAVIIDFGNLDFDSPRTLTPEPKDNPDVYEIAVGKALLPSLFRNMRIVFVENKDRDYYGLINIPDTIFVSDNNRNNVYHKVRSTKLDGLVDRDFLSDSDIMLIRESYPNLRILDYYCLENFLYHPDNLLEYNATRGLSFDSQIYIGRIAKEKDRLRETIVLSIAMARQSYSYFGEPQFNKDARQQRFKNHQENLNQADLLRTYLSSDDFETFYKVFSMKDYCRQLPERQNLSKAELAQTNWFKNRIQTVLK